MSVSKFPLEMDYVRNVAYNWLKFEHAEGVVEHLPEELLSELTGQSDEFLHGVVNAIAIVHDLAVKPLIEEIRTRNPLGVTEDPRDILVTKVGAAIEGISYVVCRQLVDRETEQ